MADQKISSFAYVLAAVVYVVGMYAVLVIADASNLLMTTAGNLIASIVAVYLETTKASWKRSLSYMVPAIVLPLIIASVLPRSTAGDVGLSMLSVIAMSGFMLPPARFIIFIFALFAQRRIQ